MPEDIDIVTIDGPAGAGKSTVAKRLAKMLHFAYLDTGAMYRALTLKALRRKISLEDEANLAALARETAIDLENHPQGVRVMLDGEDVSEDIRTLEVTSHTFYIARAPAVRAIMVDLQRRMAHKRSLVAEGRDIGTVVFPQAEYKFYLDADLEERSRRRYKELAEKGREVNAQHLTRELQERDHKDLTRSTGPLKKAEDAIFIDSTNLSVEEVIERIVKCLEEKKTRPISPG